MVVQVEIGNRENMNKSMHWSIEVKIDSDRLKLVNGKEVSYLRFVSDVVVKYEISPAIVVGRY
jgi:hypothetical protein